MEKIEEINSEYFWKRIRERDEKLSKILEQLEDITNNNSNVNSDDINNTNNNSIENPRKRKYEDAMGYKNDYESVQEFEYDERFEGNPPPFEQQDFTTKEGMAKINKWFKEYNTYIDTKTILGLMNKINTHTTEKS